MFTRLSILLGPNNNTRFYHLFQNHWSSHKVDHVALCFRNNNYLLKLNLYIYHLVRNYHHLLIRFDNLRQIWYSLVSSSSALARKEGNSKRAVSLALFVKLYFKKVSAVTNLKQWCSKSLQQAFSNGSTGGQRGPRPHPRDFLGPPLF